MFHPHTPGSDDLAWIELLLSLIVLAASLLMLVPVVVAAAVNWRAFKTHWRDGLLLSGLLVALSLPVLIFDLWYFDPAAAVEQEMGRPDNVAVTTAWVVKLIILIITPLWTLVFLTAAYVGAQAEWARCRSQRRIIRWPGARGIALGAGLGVAFGLGTSLLFYAAGVGLSRMLEQMTVSYPGVEEAPLAAVMIVSLLFAAVAAVQEELVYRGAAQGLMTRLLGGSRAALIGVNLLIALLFAAAHLINTDAPTLKFTQIFLFGLLLAWLAHRFGLTSAVAAHLGLNLTVTPVELLLMS